MGEELQKQFDAEVEYIAGSGGVYTVEVDGKEIFSKSKAGRFPELPEIITLIKNM